jgi:uncharacterized protein YndB with AHSA1/START domain
MSSLSVVVRVSRDLPFAPESVFDAWLDPARARHFFFASPAGVLQRIALEPGVGGTFTVVDRRGEEDVEHTGEYLVCERPRALTFAFKIPAYSDDATTVAVAFEPLDGGGCRVSVDAGAVPAEVHARATQGWGRMLERVEESLRAPTP